MTFDITVFGAIFIPLAVLLPVLRREYLFLLLPVAAVMQSMAVVRIGLGATELGVAAYHIVFAAMGVALVASVYRARRMHTGTGATRAALLLWVVFSMTSALGAMLLPWLFAGVPVHLMLTNVDVSAPLEPLRWTTSNLVQAVNSVGHCIVLLFAVHATRSGNNLAMRYIVVGFLGALIFTLLVGTYHRLMLGGFLPDASALLASNPSYIQSFNSQSWVPYIRTSLPFIEPSYASAWFSAVFAGGLVGIVFFRHWLAWGCILTVGAAGLANSAGLSGITAAVVFALIFFIFCAGFLGRRIWKHGLLRQHLVAIFVFVVVLAGAAYAFESAEKELKRIGTTLSVKFEETNMLGDMLGHRGKSNMTAISITKATYGMGAGAGSNRSSSYLFSLLSNTGLLGLALFLAALGLQCSLVVRNCFRQAGQNGELTTTYLGAFGCLFIAVAGGIPDQNWPVLWAFITFGLVLASPVIKPEPSINRLISPSVT